MPADSLTTGRDDARVGDAAQFGVLGPLQMSIGGALVPLGTPKQRAVLAVMVINANRPVGIDTLIDAAWDQRPPPGARATLHVASACPTAPTRPRCSSATDPIH